MKTESSKKKTIIQKTAKAMIKKDYSGWPPGCTFFAYQPMRPETRSVKKSETE